MPKWAMTTVENCLERNSLNEFPKLPRRDYKISGSYPVVDQGQSLIGGWTDDGSGLISKNLPVIIFGDHTRALKYIDFPFVRGADGTQVLKPKVGIEPQYFYYACRAINLPSRGYSRHFKTFKEKKIPFPPLSEQKRIVDGLNKKMAAVEKARAATLERAEAIRALPAAFLREIFSFDDGKLPQGWRWVQLGDVCEESRCSIDGKSIEARELPYLSLENIESHSGKIALDSDHNSYTQGTSNCFRFECGHVLYGKLRPYLNKVALPDFSGRCTTELIPISPGSDIEREFLALILRRPETVDWAMAEVTGSRMPRANMKRLMCLEIPLPPFSEQKRIIADLNKKMAAVEKARNAAEAESETINALPAAFLREAFGGTL